MHLLGIFKSFQNFLENFTDKTVCLYKAPPFGFGCSERGYIAGMQYVQCCV